MTIKQLQNKVNETVRYDYDKIITAERYEQMLCHYFGASSIISFAQRCDIIDIETEKYYQAKIEQAHDKYYENATSDFVSAHMKLF